MTGQALKIGCCILANTKGKTTGGGAIPDVNAYEDSYQSSGDKRYLFRGYTHDLTLWETNLSSVGPLIRRTEPRASEPWSPIERQILISYFGRPTKDFFQEGDSAKTFMSRLKDQAEILRFALAVGYTVPEHWFETSEETGRRHKEKFDKPVRITPVDTTS
jgi:hypothetical protein